MNDATTISDHQMNEGLKPYTLGEILDRTVLIYRKNFLLFVGIALLPTLLMVLTGGGAGFLVLWMGKSQSSTAALITGLVVLVLILVFVPLFIVIQAIVNGSLTTAAVKMHEGEKIKVREALSAAWKRGWRYIGTQFFFYLFVGIIPGAVFFILSMLVGILGALAGTAGSTAASLIVGFVVIFGFVVFFVFIVLAMIRLSLAFAACTAEELGPWQSIKRSFTLSNGSMGRIFLFGLLVYALTLAITMVFMFICMIPFFIVLSMMHGQGSVEQQRIIGVSILVVYYAAVFLAQVVIKPVYSIGLTVFYFDERVRKEGYDIEWMMKRAGLVDAAAASPQPGAVQSVPWLDATKFDTNQTDAPQNTSPTDSGGQV